MHSEDRTASGPNVVGVVELHLSLNVTGEEKVSKLRKG